MRIEQPELTIEQMREGGMKLMKVSQYLSASSLEYYEKCGAMIIVNRLLIGLARDVAPTEHERMDKMAKVVTTLSGEKHQKNQKK